MGYSLSPEREIDTLSQLSQIEKGIEMAETLGEDSIGIRLAIEARDIILRKYKSSIKEQGELLERLRRFAQNIPEIYSSVGHPRELSPAKIIEIRRLKKEVRGVYKIYLRVVEDNNKLKYHVDGLTKILK